MKTDSRMILSLAAVACWLLGNSTQAADFGDAPSLAQDAGADIGDLFAFLDPNDNTKVVLIGTFHGFLVPGEANNLAVFDPNVRYRFEIYNEHVNSASPALDPAASGKVKAAYAARVKPSRTIDVTFTPRQVGSEPQSNSANGNPIPVNLRRPKPQSATVTLTGFTGSRDHGVYPGVLVTPFNVGATASAAQIYEITDVVGTDSIRVFAGEVDDPYFADLPALTAFLDSVRNGAVSASPFNRGRDTFAGYNVLAIALRIPVTMLKGANGNVIGVDLLTQRHVTEVAAATGPRGGGAFKTVDRMGNPGANDLLVPFDLRNAYNAATAKDDVSGKFAESLKLTLTELGLVPGESSFQTLMNIYLAKGDLLQLDVSVPNTGTNAVASFPNGRRVTDGVLWILC